MNANYKVNTNNSVPCNYCRYFPVRSRTREILRNKQEIQLEHLWICPKCQNTTYTARERVPVSSNEQV